MMLVTTAPVVGTVEIATVFLEEIAMQKVSSHSTVGVLAPNTVTQNVLNTWSVMVTVIHGV